MVASIESVHFPLADDLRSSSKSEAGATMMQTCFLTSLRLLRWSTVVGTLKHDMSRDVN
jgi:hypothetical protein